VNGEDFTVRTNQKIVLFLLGVLLVLPLTVTAERTSTVEVKLVLPDGERTVRTSADTVRNVLTEEGLPIRQYDHTFPALDSRVVDGLSVFLYRDGNDSKQKDDNRQSRTPSTRTIYTSALPKDRELVVRGSAKTASAGHKKFQDTTARIVYRGGPSYKERQVEELVEEGTKTMLATGYSDHPKSTAPFDDGVSALGLPAGYGLVAVDPQVIPLGTRLYIEGYGYAIAADVGGGINGRQIDLCFDSHRDALFFGRQWVKVHILG
jgi:3D (Asp-Asp-Asp) domain-containing protein